MKEGFHFYTQYNIDLRKAHTFHSKRFNTVHSGENSFVFPGLKTWEMVPTEKKISKSLTECKINVKYCKPIDCFCMFCKIYLHQMCYL